MNLKFLFLVLAIVFAVTGFGAMFLGHNKSSMMAMVEGLAKGLAGVFFILWYIFMLMGKEPTDKTTH